VITHEEAIGQRRAYAAAAKASTVVQCRIMLRRAWTEWRRAVEMLDELDSDDYAVALFCEIIPGYIVADERGDCMVVRKMEQGGQVSLHLESRTSSAPIYVNYQGQTSPIVVLSMPMRVEEPVIEPDPSEVPVPGLMEPSGGDLPPYDGESAASGGPS
jgi:hypothetical protein